MGTMFGDNDGFKKRKRKPEDGGEIFDRAIADPPVDATVPTASTNAFNAICWRCPACGLHQIARKSRTHVAQCQSTLCLKNLTVRVDNKLEQLVPATQLTVPVGT